jgi:hypothetical protein
MHTSSLSNPRLCAIISWLPFSSFPSPFGPLAPPTPTARNPPTPLPFSSNITLNTYPGYTAANRDTHNLCDPSQCEPGSQASCVARRACSVDTHTRLCVLLVVFARSLARSSSSPCYSRRLPFAALVSLRVRFGKGPASGDSRLGKVVN